MQKISTLSFSVTDSKKRASQRIEEGMEGDGNKKDSRSQALGFFFLFKKLNKIDSSQILIGEQLI